MTSTIKWSIKPFHDLTITELYNCLQLRTQVFVVEQNCVFQDMDGKDVGRVYWKENGLCYSDPDGFLVMLSLRVF